MHPLDSAACVGAFSKGRSGSHLLNQRCRRMCAVNVAGGYDTFYPWIPSGENPADEPSRWFEKHGSSKGGTPGLNQCSNSPLEKDEAPSSEVIDLRSLPGWSGNEQVFLHRQA